MSQNTNIAVEHEKKERIPVWLYPSTLKAIDKAMYQANCKSRSEFLENAAQMYAGYISADSAVEYLRAALVSALRATIQGSENRISRLLFKLTVELSMRCTCWRQGWRSTTVSWTSFAGGVSKK